MKKITLYTILFFAFTHTSCKKFLDKQPITEFGPNFAFANVDSAFSTIVGVYSQLAGDQGYGKVLSLYYSVDNDETLGASGSPDNGRRDISRYLLTASNLEIEKPFSQCFRGIEFANICIANIPNMDLYNNGSAIEKGKLKRMHGEALTLRAQFYFEAIKNWGDLPKHFEPASVSAAKNPFPTRSNRDEIYDQIIADLKTAEDLVPWVNELSTIGEQADERITKGTVKALRARIALFRGGYSLRNESSTMERRSDYATYYQIAKDECAEIVASGVHNLNPSFKNLWKNQVCAHVISDPENELMFQVGAVGVRSLANSKIGFYNGPVVAGNGTKGIYIVPSYFYSFDSMDLRRDVTCAPYTVGVDGITKTAVGMTSMADGKYRRDWVTNPSILPSDPTNFLSLKWQIIRYSDVLLMFAEAENELNGPTTAAYEAINKVRRRGFGKSINAPSDKDLQAGLNKAQFFNALARERSFELGGEGIRKYDLVRWNLLETKINTTRLELADMAARSGNYTDYPSSMYYLTGTTADDGSMWANSLYQPAPSSTNPPPNSTRISWMGSSIGTTTLARYAVGFTPNKSELLPIPQNSRGANPNLTQNPGY